MQSSRLKQLFKTTGILLIARISVQIVSFLLLPLYTALLSTAEYGEIDVYSSLTMIIVPFLTLQLEMGLFRFFILDADDGSRRSIVSTTIFIEIIALVVASIVYWISTCFFHLAYPIETYLYYTVMALSAVLLQLCRAQEKTVLYGIANVLTSVVAIILNVLFIAYLHWGVIGVLRSTIIAYAIQIVFLIIATRIDQYLSIKSYDIAYRKKLLAYSIPLIFNQISSWLINYSDRLIILHFWGVSSNGIYSLATKFSNILSAFFGVYNIAWSENAIRSFNDEDRDEYISKVFNATFILYTIVISLIINVLPFVFRLFVRNSDYFSAYNHIPILLLAMLFTGMAATIGSVYIALGKTKEVSITTSLAGACNIIVHFCMLTQFKLYAASISTLVSFFLLLIYRIVFIRKHISIAYQKRQILVYLALFAITWIGYVLNNTICLGAVLVVNMISAYFYIKRSGVLSRFVHRK